MAKTEKSYRELHAELEALLNNLQSSDIDVDEAIETYEQAEVLIKQLEARLKEAEITIKKLEKRAED